MERLAWKTSHQKRCRGIRLPAVLLAFGGLLLAVVSLNAASFTATLDRDTIILGESVTLSLKFEGGSPPGTPGLPPVKGIHVEGLSTSMNTTSTPQGTSTTYSYNFTLVPSQAGEFVIPALQTQINGAQVTSQPVHLKVLAADPDAPEAELANRSAFLKWVLPKNDIYVNQVFVAELRLYLRPGTRRIGELQLPPGPEGEGFTSGKFVQGQNYQRRVGNRQFIVLPLQAAITPAKAGELTFNAIDGRVVINPRDIMDFDSFFGGRSDTEQVRLMANPEKIRVLPLPKDQVPAGFTGAVGNYTMTVTAGPTNVIAGDPVTLHVEISGTGPLDTISLPLHDEWRDFKVYPSTTKPAQTSDQFGLQGSKTFEQVVIPQNTEVKELPEFSFSFFDPDSKSYRTLKQPAIPLLVRPAASVPMPTVAAAPRSAGPENPPPQQDIVPIKQHLGKTGGVYRVLATQTWFVTAQCVPVLAWLAAFVWRKRTDSLANNPRLRRQRRVAQIIRDGLAELRQLAAQNKPDEFFATLFRLMQEQLGERLDTPASAITEAVVDDRLRALNLSADTLGELQELFQLCNQARYAPVRGSQELAAIIPRFESVIRALQGVKV